MFAHLVKHMQKLPAIRGFTIYIYSKYIGATLQNVCWPANLNALEALVNNT